MMRRLHPGDEDVLRLAWSWDEGRPVWYGQMDRVFNNGSSEDFLAQLGDPLKAFIGVWGDEMEGVIIAEWKGGGFVEGHLLARRRADTQLLTVAIRATLIDLLNCGLTHAFSWVAERNTGVRNLCVSIGMQPDGVAMWRGSYRGRVIKWLSHSIQREQLLINMAA